MIDSNCPIWVLGKGFCWAPSAAWGCSDAELCKKCQAKPRIETPAIVDLISPVNQRCETCGGETYKGRLKCAECQIKRKTEHWNAASGKTCRFCGMQNVHYKQWRKKDSMCSQKACWDQFLEELKAEDRLGAI